MLGLADRTRIIDLFEALMRGDMGKALGELRDQYDSGADPAVVLSDLAEFTHFVTRVKVVPAVADDPSLAEAERTRGRAFATQLSMRVLSRTWQMLFKGIDRGEGGRQAARGGRDGAGAHRLCGRPADARRGDPRHAERRGRAGRRACAANGALRRRRRQCATAARRGSIRRAAAPRASLAPAQLVTAQVPDISTLRADGRRRRRRLRSRALPS